MQPVQSPPMLSVSEVARRLRVSKSTVYRWVHEGTLGAVRHGKQWSRGQEGRGGAIRIPEDQVAAVVTSAAAAPEQAA
jgi:excisionase family DNA binding protein